MSYYKASLLQKAAFPDTAEASSIPTAEPYTNEKGDLYVKSFIINSKPNKRGWQVDAETLPDRIKTIIGKPLVIDRDPSTGKIDHPKYYPWKSRESNLEAQKKKAVGVVENVYYDHDTDSYYAHSRVTDPKAREFILANWDKKLAVSPQLIYDEKKEPSSNYYKNAYEFTHLSLVDAGAYGPSAVMIGKCTGTGDVCKKELEAIAAASASVQEKKKAATAASLPTAFLNSLVRAPPNGKVKGRLA